MVGCVPRGFASRWWATGSPAIPEVSAWRVSVNVLAVIPARHAAVRFPGKPLADQTGKFLVQHVYEQVTRARSVQRVVVATDDPRIADAVKSFGGECVMTRPDHPSGTDRVAEVAGQAACDLALNVQGDEPEIEPASIDTLVRLLGQTDHPMGTLACSFAALQRLGVHADPSGPHAVKVVIAGGRAVYFSRSLIPYPRRPNVAGAGPYLHLGIYAYRRDFLLKLATLAPTPLEETEGLEQLRVLEHGYPIAVGLVDRASVGIDTPDDYAAFVKRWRERQAVPSAGVDTP